MGFEVRNRRLLSSVGVALLAVVALGCGSSTSAAATQQDSAFLAAVHGNAPDIGSYRSDVSLIRLGHAACDGFRSGVSYQQLADRLVLIQGSHPVPTADLGAVITAAVASFCPQYESLIH
ncbi:DUF732 domain-containing protein [Acidiferrimicrobium sp. IK]|uniref:DUF732 domain-containing protein n=1 Tax=Acidiferrimicrobium sp. IK TaxID=2871700 RepID=UPI0021CB204E|nr:DUF732 domain-containing protein [Acidiferrimicrobium sp. IK]MCU4185670.1 DUF732 domain-containing protein [Acidiferrimicrobium sp. IK]